MSNWKKILLILSSCLFIAVFANESYEKLFKAYCDHDNIEEATKCVEDQIDEEFVKMGKECIVQVNPNIDVTDIKQKRDYFCDEAKKEDLHTYYECLDENYHKEDELEKVIEAWKECLGIEEKK
ncbi:uncharacterized protein LOC111629131 [Centruroides sculpturatus]|uniref:uncharacterized protein LOC111629131 n=1 Tax=Centruroides sculpturatus TaxID=218467 RepID=UPI000C6CB2FC|nr:uncharacterized protein LOC111629131 [Centruroides sculpturatus]